MKNIEDAEKKQIDEEEENPTQAAKISKLSSIQCDKNEQDEGELHRLSEKDLRPRFPLNIFGELW